MDDYLVGWDSEAPDVDAQVDYIEPFDARGMTRVYGRGEGVERHLWFNIDIWKTRDGRLLMRFWSRSKDVYWHSFEITGVDPGHIPEGNSVMGFPDSWIPRAVREEFDRWILDGREGD